jgi:hypothetical protein
MSRFLSIHAFGLSLCPVEGACRPHASSAKFSGWLVCYERVKYNSLFFFLPPSRLLGKM